MVAGPKTDTRTVNPVPNPFPLTLAGLTVLPKELCKNWRLLC
jgi:hypothetical protein